MDTKLKIYIIVVIWISCGGSVKTAMDTDVRNLLTEIFTTKSYNKLVRPASNQSKPIDAFVEYFLFGINDVDDVEQKLTTTGYLDIAWQDKFLSWDPTLYGGLEYLYLPQGYVWKPDLSLLNGFKNIEELGSAFLQVLISYDGMVVWQPFQVFQSKCNLDSTYFPFDKQTCHLDFVVWSLTKHDVNLLVGPNGINLDKALESNGQWEIISSASAEEKESVETKIRFTINMKRKPLYVIINVLVPVILLSVLNLFTFRIPADMGERMGYTITVWLAFAVFLTIVSASLPKSSDSVPVMALYIMIQIVTGTLTVLISALESRAVCHSEQKPISPWLRRVLKITRRCSVQPTNTADKPDLTDTWKEGIAALDSVLFWMFCILFLATTFIILLIAASV